MRISTSLVPGVYVQEGLRAHNFCGDLFCSFSPLNI